MSKHGITLLKSQGAFRNRQQFFSVNHLTRLAVKNRRRGCVIAGIDSQIIWHLFHPVFMFYSFVYFLLRFSSFAIAPSTPLMKE